MNPSLLRRILFLWLLGGLCSLPAASRPPNVLLLLSDDQRFDTIHALGNADIQTPNLDRIAREGFAFTHAFIMGSGHVAVCMPSRAMLLTGRTLFRATTSFTNNVIPPSAATLPGTLRGAGYDAYHVGKWHNDQASFVRSYTGGGAIFFGGMSDHLRVPIHDFDPAGIYLPAHQRIGAKISSELFADAAIDVLRGHTNAHPFFLSVAFTAPHDPRTAPQAFADLYPPASIRLPPNFLLEHPFDNGEMTVRAELLLPKPRPPDAVRREIAGYYALITHMDAQVGRILDALEAAGHARDTIVIFAGDNGLAVGQHGLLGKQNLYDHSLRVPLLFRGPGVPRGGRSDALVYLFDVLPTVCDMLGLPRPATVEGQSLSPLLAGRSARLRDHVFGAFREVQRMVRDDRWKLIWYPKINRCQLFDLQADPWEVTDLVAQPQQLDRVVELKKRLAAAQDQYGDMLPERPTASPGKTR